MIRTELENTPQVLQKSPEIARRFAAYHLISFLLGFSVQLKNPEALTTIPSHALLAVFPHRTHLDTVAVQLALERENAARQSVIVKGEYWKDWRRKALELIMTGSSILNVDKGDSTGVMQVVRYLKKQYEESNSNWVIIYPEGTRDGVNKIDEGAAFLAKTSKFDLVPVTVHWSAPVLKKGDRIPGQVAKGVLASLTLQRRQATVEIGSIITSENKSRQQLHEELSERYHKSE
jgi:1-acyl-sn-glycerol-3-phosphate acyltransferase